MERKTESFERRRCFPRAEPQMPAVPAGWRVDLSLPGMQILHKLYTSDVRRRTCMRRDETSDGTRGTSSNRIPPPLLCHFLSFLSLFHRCSLFTRVCLSAMLASRRIEARYEDANRKEISDSTFHLGYLVESGGEKLENRVQVFLISLEEINFSINF